MTTLRTLKRLLAGDTWLAPPAQSSIDARGGGAPDA